MRCRVVRLPRDNYLQESENTSPYVAMRSGYKVPDIARTENCGTMAHIVPEDCNDSHTANEMLDVGRARKSLYQNGNCARTGCMGLPHNLS